jgi:hypothetical protein
MSAEFLSEEELAKLKEQEKNLNQILDRIQLAKQALQEAEWEVARAQVFYSGTEEWSLVSSVLAQVKTTSGLLSDIRDLSMKKVLRVREDKVA